MQVNGPIKGANAQIKDRVLAIKRRTARQIIADLLHLSPKYVQAALCSRIRPYHYFDEAWYRLAYQKAIEFPDDLLCDYVKAGIQNGRDPSPYFNTILYLREHSVRPEQALIHYLRSGQAIASGAYRDGATLIAAQHAYQAGTETRLIRDERVVPKPFAVFLQSGAASTWRDWRPSVDQPWHLLINHYDPTFAGKIPCEVEFTQLGKYPGTKFTALHSILTHYPHILAPYEYILFLDDDVAFEADAITHLFSIVQPHGWGMAQASLSPDSSCSFPVFFNAGSRGWREVNGVELMMPVYSSRILGYIKQLIGQSVSGWGFDPALSVLAARKGLHAAVVDEVVAYHLRQINADSGSYYQMLHQAQIYPEIEFTHLQKKYGFTQPLYYEVSPFSSASGMQL